MVSATKLLVAVQPDSSGAARQNAATAMDFATDVKVDLLLVGADVSSRTGIVRGQRQNRPAHAFPARPGPHNLTLIQLKILMGPQRVRSVA